MGFLQDFAMVSYAPLKKDRHVALKYYAINSFRKIPTRRIAGWSGIVSFRFLKNLHTDFHSGKDY